MSTSDINMASRGSYEDSEKRRMLMVDRAQNVVKIDGDGKSNESLLQ